VTPSSSTHQGSWLSGSGSLVRASSASLGTGEFSGNPNGEGEALRKDLLPGNDVVPAVNPDRHATGGVLLLHDSVDPAATEDFPADSTNQHLVAIGKWGPRETGHEPLGAAARLVTPPAWAADAPP